MVYRWKRCLCSGNMDNFKFNISCLCCNSYKLNFYSIRIEAMKNLGSMLKSRDITLPTKVRPVKDTVFPAVMYGCESWTGRKAAGRNIDAFGLWSWRRLLRVPWTAAKSKPPILKETNPEYSSEELMLPLKLPILRPPATKN